jgi:hypothetical protein
MIGSRSFPAPVGPESIIGRHRSAGRRDYSLFSHSLDSVI